MADYYRFAEHNEWEGETWYFYIPAEGNEEAIEQLRQILEEVELTRVYEISMKKLKEKNVNLYCKETDSGYMSFHNKLSGKLINIDTLLFGENEDPLYKGGIRNFMEGK